ncbi:hypothetical protein DWUX_131 [Desulfovibrio diazotrophicus]|nr:hypothetical protein DWUX_131 [Desulfovibrio diazotrophicus]
MVVGWFARHGAAPGGVACLREVKGWQHNEVTLFYSLKNIP